MGGTTDPSALLSPTTARKKDRSGLKTNAVDILTSLLEGMAPLVIRGNGQNRNRYRLVSRGMELRQTFRGTAITPKVPSSVQKRPIGLQHHPPSIAGPSLINDMTPRGTDRPPSLGSTDGSRDPRDRQDDHGVVKVQNIPPQLWKGPESPMDRLARQ